MNDVSHIWVPGDNLTTESPLGCYAHGDMGVTRIFRVEAWKGLTEELASMGVQENTPRYRVAVCCSGISTLPLGWVYYWRLYILSGAWDRMEKVNEGDNTP